MTAATPFGSPNDEEFSLRDLDEKSSSMSTSLIANESTDDLETRGTQAIEDLSDEELEEVGDVELEEECDVDPDELEIRQHPSYEQVLLDVNRCAGRLESIRQVYLHRTDEDDEPIGDLRATIDLQYSVVEEASDDGLAKAGIEANEQGGIDPDTPSSIDGGRTRKIARDLHDQKKLKTNLASLIVRLLIKKPELHYYQGFHDVCLTYMTMLGERGAFTKLDKLVDSHFSVFMQKTMNETQEFLALIPFIVGAQDKKTQEFLERAEVGTIFALSWVITWFSHVIMSQSDVERIFEFLEDQDPTMVLYLSAAIVLHKKEQLLELEPEMSTVHHFLCQVPRKEALPIERLISEAMRSYLTWSPEIIKQKLSDHRRAKLRVQNTSVIESIAHNIGPILTGVISNRTATTAIVVLVVASALALQFDRWIR